MELKSIRMDLHSQMLTTRALYRCVLTSQFEEAFANTNDLGREELKKILDSGNQLSLQRWIEMYRDTSCNTMRELRLLGQRLGVTGFQYLSKSSLLSAIRNKEATNVQ